MSDTEVCFRALYSVMLLRIQGKEEDASYIKDVMEIISPHIARLTKMYHDVERGNVDLFKSKEE